MAFNIENFRKVNLAPGSPSISITRNGITFNKAAIVKLLEPEWVNLLIDEEEKAIAVLACKEDEDKAISFLSKRKKIMSVRWNNKDFLQTLEELMDWDLNIAGYKVNGIFDRNQNVLFFDLKTASYLNEKNRSDDV